MDKQLVIQGNPIVLDLSLLGGGKVVISNNTNDNKVFLEGFSSDGNGSAAEMLITGRNATPLPVFVVRADTTFISGRELRFDLSPNGGGQLAIGNNPNDNKIFIEGLSRDGTGNADELFITGNSAQPLPFFSVIADTASFSGDVHAKGQVLNHHADCA